MKKILSFLFLLTTLAASSQSFTSLPVSSELPLSNLKLKDISGKEITLKDAMKKNGLLVMFSCNTCPVVVRNQQRTRDICSYALQNDIGVVLLNSNEASRNDDDSYEAMKVYAASQHYNWPYAVDKNSKLADAFGASRTPEVYLFNNTGKLIYKGAIDDNPQNPGAVKRVHLKEAIGESLQGKTITVKESRSLGCGIKRLG
ncbi:MAG: thiol-disulfide isomerase [Chitinophagaceae bacterium]|nr:thiol-disulfide isomerase [Chitinophagaceae bacterium]